MRLAGHWQPPHLPCDRHLMALEERGEGLTVTAHTPVSQDDTFESALAAERRAHAATDQALTVAVGEHSMFLRMLAERDRQLAEARADYKREEENNLLNANALAQFMRELNEAKAALAAEREARDRLQRMVDGYGIMANQGYAPIEHHYTVQKWHREAFALAWAAIGYAGKAVRLEASGHEDVVTHCADEALMYRMKYEALRAKVWRLESTLCTVVDMHPHPEASYMEPAIKLVKEMNARRAEGGKVTCPKCGLEMKWISYPSGRGRCSDCGSSLASPPSGEGGE